jgi:ketosteroid isomerase-like protein
MTHARLVGLLVLLGASLDACSPPVAPAVPVSAAAGQAAAGQPVEALIKRQSQEFSDASASGDAAVLARYLDDRVIFMNESGEMATKKDILESAVPSPPGTSNTLTQTDWKLEMHGSVAVTSFTDVSTQSFHGQTLHASYRSTEVWLEREGAWRMVSSQTMAVPEDPPAVSLSSRILDEYVGTYTAGPDFTYTIARSGNELTGAVGTAKGTVLKAELVDVLFAPGQPRGRKIFQRDAAGKVIGFVSRREGHDLVLKRVS